MAKGKERAENLVELLRRWQALERKGFESVSEIQETTDNPVIRQFMEIIRNDTVQHHRVQQFMIDLLTAKQVTLSWEQMGEISEKLQEHNDLEKKTVELAKQLKDETTDFLQRQFLDYLLTDESKHVAMLANLDELKRHFSKLH